MLCRRLNPWVRLLVLVCAVADHGMARVDECALLASQFQIVFNHQRHQLRKLDLGLPAQLGAGLGGVSQQVIYFRGPEVARIGLDMLFPIESTESGSSV